MIRCCCLVIACMSCIAYHVIMCISFAYMFVSCIRAFSPLSILHSGAPISSGGPFYLSFVCGGLDISGLDQDLPSGLGLLPVDRLSSFVSFGLRLILQRLPRDRKGLVCVAAQHPSNLAQNPPKPASSSRAFDHDRVAENRTSFGLS